MKIFVAVCTLVLLGASPALSQTGPELRVERADGSVSDEPVPFARGYAATDISLLETLGWTVTEAGDDITVSVPGEIVLSLRIGTPFFRWDGTALQMADPPYRDGSRVFLPLQLLTDFFPRRLPDLYEFEGSGSLLRAGDPGLVRAGSGTDAAPANDDSVPPSGAIAAPEASEPSAEPSPYDGPRVVIIDPGHGGADPGALGPRGIREKDVALAIATELAEILRRQPNFEVHMTRDSDTFVDLWKRGEMATELKGERFGLFVSIHANSFPNRRSTRGFETYFLSEARTEHERRVSAIENAPLSFQGQDVDPAAEPDLGFILRELRNLDQQHWSELLAELAQDELDVFHPGPNRGVKQGVLAVLTNAIMPAVLVETGYLSNEDEGLLLGEASFQKGTAGALAQAIVRFFERYPPGNGTGGSGEEE